VTRLLHAHGGEEGLVEDTSELITPGEIGSRRVSKSQPGVTVIGASDTWVKLSRCCTPVPGDEVFGFVTRGSGISVHRTDCINADSLREQSERIVEVQWTPGRGSVYLVNIQVEALDRARLLSDVTKTLSDQHVNILNASVTTNRDRVAISRFTFEMADPSHLNQILRAVRGVDGVFDVYRV
jgi:GTP pyrophosphokinase